MNHFNFTRINDEVFVARDPIVQVGSCEIDFIKGQSAINSRKRARICMHKSNEDTLHEMIIAISANSYIQPHKHLNKSESFHIIEGEVDVIIFDDIGNITNIIELGDLTTNKKFLYRLDQAMFHTILLKTEFLIMHEITNGSFLQDQTLLASWAPLENDSIKTKIYMKHLMRFTQEHNQDCLTVD